MHTSVANRAPCPFKNSTAPHHPYLQIMLNERFHSPDAEELDERELQVANSARGAVIMRHWGITTIVILLIYSNHLYRMAQWLSQRPQYQAFPLVLAGFVWLAWMRFPQILWPEQTSFSVRNLLSLGFSASTFYLAGLLNSPWLGLISCILTLWTSVWYFGGWSAASQLRGPFCFLALLIPLPLELDQRLVVSLQQVATTMASAALEWQGVWHSVSGVVLRTAENQYMVEEACSGIYSLFAAVSVMLFFCLYFRYGACRSTLTMLITVVWVVVANGLRVFLMVYFDSRFQIALDEGWRHEALGFATYFTSVMLTLSSDQLMRFVIPLVVDDLMEVEAEFHQRVTVSFNQVFFRLFDEPRLLGRWATLAPVVLFAVLFFAGGGYIHATTRFAPEAAGPELKHGNLQDIVDQDSLRTETAGWVLTDFKELAASKNAVFNVGSSRWKCKGHGFSVSVSVDGYYGAWHDLAVCYQGLGWKLLTSKNDVTVPPAEPQDRQVVSHTEYTLSRPGGSYGFVIFSAMDSKLHSVSPPPRFGSLLRSFQDRLRTDFWFDSSRELFTPPVIQIQLIAETDQELLPHERELLIRLFVELRSQILKQLKGSL